jgi:hypothetical protein
MIWLTWRQHRLQLLFGAAALAALAAFLLPTGLGISQTFHRSGLAACLAAPGRDCSQLIDAFGNRYTNLQFLIPLFLAIPLAVGVFWGAPLVSREVEQGTHRLAWTQSVTRDRWMGVNLIALVGAAVVGSALFSWLLSWWSRPFIIRGDSRFNPGVFDLRGIVPIAYAVFALAVGILAGTLLRRTVAAMGTTIAVYAATRIGVTLWLRQHYMAAKTLIFSPALKSGVPFGHGDWILSTKTVDAAGRLLGDGRGLDLGALTPRCPGLLPADGSFPDPSKVSACVNRLGIHVVAKYQPGSRYWTFQGIESAIFLALSVGLIAVSIWWVRQRVS